MGVFLFLVWICRQTHESAQNNKRAQGSPGRLSDQEGDCIDAKALRIKDTPYLATWGCFFFCSFMKSLKLSKSMTARSPEKPTYKTMTFSMHFRCSIIRKYTEPRRASLHRGVLHSTNWWLPIATNQTRSYLRCCSQPRAAKRNTIPPKVVKRRTR